MARPARPSIVAFVVVLASLGGLALLARADEVRERRLRLRQAEEPLRARDWKAAVTSLRTFREREAGTPEAEEAWVLEARALLLAGASREALDADRSRIVQTDVRLPASPGPRPAARSERGRASSSRSPGPPRGRSGLTTGRRRAPRRCPP